ncbi:MAG: DUF503 domain-containing protein [Cellulosilyticum sp.]|nr:DUF503 domain-containing protein [Cellulosilyticum sp.]
MLVGTLQIKCYAPYVHSLKEKRMIVKSISGRLKSRFNISVGEVGQQDIHQTIIIGIATIADSTAQCDSILDHIIDFVEENCEAEMTEVIREIR